MQDPQPSPFEVRVALYFLSRETNAVTIGHQRLAILLRSRVMVEELGMLAPPALRTGSTRRIETKDSDAHDLTARHFLVYCTYATHSRRAVCALFLLRHVFLSVCDV